MSHDIDAVVGRLCDSQALAKLIGESQVFARTVASLPSIGRHDGTVLITGETGTGKELFARAIHYLSDRNAHPFVPVNCGSLSESLVEDTLFGHESGAFTDARGRATGLVAAADKGTLFLDEIGTLRTGAQSALLRFLQDGSYRVLGSTREQRADARIVAATNAPLEQMVQSGAFRADLYYRLRVFSIEVPPLRERHGDVRLLASHFLRRHAPSGTTLEFSADALAALIAYGWPGNVRELEHAIVRAVATRATNIITPDDLAIPNSTEQPDRQSAGATRTRGPYQALKREAIAAFERRYLADLLADHRGNVTHAARAAGKDRRELARLLKKHTFEPRSFR